MRRAVSCWLDRLARRRLRAAPRRLQLAAGLLDSPAGIGGWWLFNGALWLRGRREGVLPTERLAGRRVRIGWEILTIAISVCLAMSGSPGRRLAGIGLVNVRTGKRLSLREALRYAALQAAMRLLRRAAMRLPALAVNRVWGTTLQQATTARKEHMARLKELQRTHPDDPRAFEQAVAERSATVSPIRSCLPAIAGLPLNWALSRANRRATARSPLKQDLVQQIAGVALVVVDEAAARRLEAKLTLASWRQRR